MNWKNTWILVGSAAALFAFIVFVERRFIPPSGIVKSARPLFEKFNPSSATTVTLRRGNQFFSTLERTNDGWHFTKPFPYPAASFAVQNFLETLDRVVPATHISVSELRSRKQTPADFGFDSPPVVVGLSRNGEGPQVRFGARTPAGDQVYVEITDQPGIYVVNSDLLDKIPRTAYDWRNMEVFHLGDDQPDRLEISHNGTGYELQLDPTNRTWKLTRPQHRADQSQAREVIRRIQLARVVEFVTDEARADGDGFGLQPPEFEVTIGSGNVAHKVQFGRSPTNNPGLVYARLVAHGNVVLVPKTVIDTLATPLTELRERQLIAFAPELIDVIEVSAEEEFTVRKDPTGRWKAGDMPADGAFIYFWLGLLARLEVTSFVRDVVTDFGEYGLKPAQRQYTLRTAITNGASVTNIFVASVAVGTNTTNGIFARRWDEKSVYGISAMDFSHMPVAAWQFRDHRIWDFSTNQVVRIALRQGEDVHELLRQPNGEWVPVPGKWTGDFNPFAIEELTRNLGQLMTTMWIARGDSVRAHYGFDVNAAQLTVELKGADKPQLLTVEFGGLSPLRQRYGLTAIDGQPTVFEFPWTLYGELQSFLHLAPVRR